MKNVEVQQKLNQAAARFTAKKMPITAQQLLENVVEAMAAEGGIGGFKITPQKTVIVNHGNCYCLQLQFQEHKSRCGNGREYEFLELLKGHCAQKGISPRRMEYHLGRNYSSKHHLP